jgi:hypothetical protein
MPNPARELANLLQEWSNKPGESVVSVTVKRGGYGSDETNVEFWRQHCDAFGYIVELERRMDDLERAGHDDVAASRGVLPACYRAIVLPSQSWSGSNPRLLNEQQMASLRLLATLIDVTEGRAELTLPKRRALLECIEDAIGALGEAADFLDENERRYILNLLNNVQSLLNERRALGSVNLTNLVDQLSGALLGAGLALSSSGETTLGKRLYSLAQRVTAITRLAVYDAAAVATIVAPLTPAILALGPGSAPGD